MKWTARLLLGVCVLAGVSALLVFRPRLPAAERGRRLAEKTGCFACHGPEGLRGAANPGRVDRTVPTFEGDVMMFARSPEEIREWIRDGVTAKKAQSRSWQADRDRGALRMPAFRERLSERQIDDLVAYVMATSGSPEPPDGAAARGLERADALGCFGCHGPGGRLGRRNPGSFKGYVASWDGADFPELVRDSTEFAHWVTRGTSHRLERNPIARFFLRRAVLRMPAYERHLKSDDVSALWDYVRWLRQTTSQTSPTDLSKGTP